MKIEINEEQAAIIIEAMQEIVDQIQEQLAK